MTTFLNFLFFTLILLCLQKMSISTSNKPLERFLWHNNKSDKLSFWDILQSINERPRKVRTLAEFNEKKDEYAVLDFIGLVERHNGYKAKEYEVVTDDGYILKLHRITASPLSKNIKEKKPVYIQHGLFVSSDFMVVQGPNYSLAFLLADADYDVWIGNVRGNSYSRKHKKLSPEYNHVKFWNFTMDHMAEYDLPKFVDKILEETNKSSLTFIGYSMGVMLSYMFLSEKPEYNKKINLLVNVAPSVYFSKADIVTRTNVEAILKYASITNNYEVLIQSVGGHKFALKYCNTSRLQTNLCNFFLSPILTSSKITYTEYPELSAYIPAGTSFFVVQHYKQLTKVYRKLQKHVVVDECDFPSFICSVNYKWKLRSAVEYDISKVTVPNVIFYSKHDFIVKVEDAKYLKTQLKNVVAFEEVPDPKFNHLDFMWHVKAKTLVYDRMFEIMNNHL